MPTPIWNVPATSYALPELTPLAASTFTLAGGSMTVTLAGTANKLTYIEEIDLEIGSATAGGDVSITVTGLANTLYFNMAVTASDSIGAQGQFHLPIPAQPASASNTSIVITSSSFAAAGVGTLTVFGFQTPLGAGQS